MIHFIAILISTVISILVGAAFCHNVWKLGPNGQRISDWLCKAPGLDVAITYFTILPMFWGAMARGWSGFIAAVAGQVIGTIVWERIHEALHPEAMQGPRIVKVINSKVGTLRNHLATWVTAIATPLFWFVRLCEIFLYPIIVWLVRLPAYDDAEWVNVSRQKFSGLVGHDLIWCLYCDWMTGVWSLGSEMLRNVESFWCPIRFASGKKCANCTLDFPDLDNGWVDANGTMTQVVEKLDAMYSPDADHPWFGHPVRLTVRGEPVEGGK